ncbi:MAG: 5-dehydro-2-deoxygluconokinase [Trueperaceae bacterium]|nr:5-dehydro-2-deoxygluconokinase [Trueperaceae bacterium]
MGRVSMDLFSEQLGAPFVEIASFATSVGGSPSNVAIGSSRLGLKTALITGLGRDKVGDFVLTELSKEGIDCRYVWRKSGRTGLAVVGVEPPSSFPLTFYRENPADLKITIADISDIDFGQARSLLVSGTGLAKSPRREATFFAAEQARQTGTMVFIDLDLRPDQWHDARAYGVNLRAFLPLADNVIATEEESYAALIENSNDPNQSVIGSLSHEQVRELEAKLLDFMTRSNSPEVWVLKRGAKGVSIFSKNHAPIHVPGFEVAIVNTVGAGDAFASAFIYGYLQGWPLEQTARFANACGAIVVSRHGCSKAMPYLHEVKTFLETRE